MHPAHVRGDEASSRPTIRAGGARGRRDRPATIQRYLNFHFSVTIDLFGADESSNAATFYSAGPQGPLRGRQARRRPRARRARPTGCSRYVDGRLVERDVPMLNALNEVLRDDFIQDSVAGIGRWNKVHREDTACRTASSAPHKAFNRRIGPLAGLRVTPAGRRRRRGDVAGAREGEWLPTPEDRAFVASLMGRVVEPGRFAGLDRAAAGRRQPAADRLRVRALRLRRCTASAQRRRATRAARSDDGGRAEAAPHRPRDLHPLQHLRGDLPESTRSRTTRATTSSTPASAMRASPASRPCPTGAIDNWRIVAA